MKKRTGEDEVQNRPKSAFMKNKKHKNMKRLGGKGLSLEAFANVKSTTDYYNPALISMILLNLGCVYFFLIFYHRLKFAAHLLIVL